MRLFPFLFTAALLLAAPLLRADQPQAQASFSPQTASVGEAVRFVIDVVGAQEVEHPPQVKVDGLDIRYSGSSTRWEMNFERGSITRTPTVSYIYQATPERTGEFMVPALTVQVGGKNYATQPAALSVQAGDAPDDNARRTGVMEIVLPKKTAYVGEALPTELRLTIDAQTVYRLENVPSFEADSFTKTKLSEARQSTIVRNGHNYEVITMRTALTPTKAGKFTAGPAVFQYVAQVPRAQPRNPRRFGNSLFDQFFNDPIGGFSQAQRVTATSEVVEVDVKPLPVPGRPASFAGAVGQFTLHAQGTPARVKMGDPITMNVTVSGTGNFDRVGAPVLADPAGWRGYPPTASFRGDGNLGINGTKSFEIAVIPEAKKEAMPVYEFSYFDPLGEKYVTLRTDAAPLVVEGQAPVPGAPEVRGPTRLAAAATPTPPPVVKPTDILGIRYDIGELHEPQPLYTQRAFLYAQLVPLGLLCGMAGLRFWPRNRSGRRLARLRRERAGLRGRLRRESDRAAFFAAAARLLQVDTALRTGHAPEAIHPDEVGEAPIVREVFATHAQARYSGAERAETLPREERHRIINALTPLLDRK